MRADCPQLRQFGLANASHQLPVEQFAQRLALVSAIVDHAEFAQGSDLAGPSREHGSIRRLGLSEPVHRQQAAGEVEPCPPVGARGRADRVPCFRGRDKIRSGGRSLGPRVPQRKVGRASAAGPDRAGKRIFRPARIDQRADQHQPERNVAGLGIARPAQPFDPRFAIPDAAVDDAEDVLQLWRVRLKGELPFDDRARSVELAALERGQGFGKDRIGLHGARLSDDRRLSARVAGCTACSSPSARPSQSATCLSTRWTAARISAGRTTCSCI
jgi:hypothetical protein